MNMNGDAIKFKTYRYTDNQVFGCEAFSMLIPEDWIVSGGIIWRQHATMPGAIFLSVRSGNGFYELNFIPSMPYYWGQSGISLFGSQEGNYYMGNEVRRPVSGSLQYLQQYILPRSNFRTRITGCRRYPEIENILRSENQGGPGRNVSVDACIADLEYSYQEDLFDGYITCGIALTQMMYGQSSWIADRIISTRAPKGKMDHASRIFGIMLKSFQFNLQWYSYYHQFVQQLTQYVLQDIYNAGVISRIIRNTYGQISDIVRRSYENQQAANDRVYQGFSESIRGVNSYYDPYKGYSVEFPVDYRYVYANALGEYIVTDNPNYNPNVGSNLNWTNLNRV